MNAVLDIWTIDMQSPEQFKINGYQSSGWYDLDHHCGTIFWGCASIGKKNKGLIILNPAVGGWSRGEGGQKILDTCLRVV